MDIKILVPYYSNFMAINMHRSGLDCIFFVMAIKTKFMGIKILFKKKMKGHYSFACHYIILKVYNKRNLMIKLALEFN